MGIRRRFSREFKLNIVHELETKKLSEVCRIYDLSISVVSKWRKDFESNPTDAFKGHGNQWTDSARIAEYQRIIGRLYEENVLLKNAYQSAKQQQLSQREKKTR